MMGPAGNYEHLKHTCYPHRDMFRPRKAFLLPHLLAYLVLCDLGVRACRNTLRVPGDDDVRRLYGRRGMHHRGALATAVAMLAALAAPPARAVVIELKDVASDRVERQRAEAIGQLPLPGTPNVGQLAERLADKQMAIGNPIMIRVFKASSELELWMQTGGRYELFATYPICNWSGTLGPKLLEGDKQSPEGVYTVTPQQMHLVGRHPRSLNLGFPNALDRQMNHTGSYILIHGGCSSVGCFAMTNPVIEEVYSLALAALTKGKQDAFQVHVYPFRMTEERLRAYATNEWYDFWRNLKDVNDSFERTRLPPRITICEGRYWAEDNTSAAEVAAHGPLAVCAVSLAEAASSNGQADASLAVAATWWPQRAMLHPVLVPSRPAAPMVRSHPANTEARAAPTPQWSLPSNEQASTQSSASARQAMLAMTLLARTGQFASVPRNRSPSDLGTSRLPIPCSQIRASCRHWVATQSLTHHLAAARAKHLLTQNRTARAATRRL